MTDETITISRSEYDALVEAREDLRDIMEARDIMRRVDAGEEDILPSEFVSRMIEGENILKLWREHRGYSQSELARLSEVNRVQIADIEAGRRRGSVDTLKKLADAIGVTVDDLI